MLEFNISDKIIHFVIKSFFIEIFLILLQIHIILKWKFEV